MRHIQDLSIVVPALAHLFFIENSASAHAVSQVCQHERNLLANPPVAHFNFLIEISGFSPGVGAIDIQLCSELVIIKTSTS